jgi:RimJ/RimL family protein N-acetyltransferase
MEPLRITTPRLNLRPLEPADAPAVFAYRSLPEVFRYQNWLPADAAEVGRLIEDQRTTGPGVPGTWSSSAIILKEDGAVIGDLGVHFAANDRGEVEIGITLSPEYQRHGFALEALEAALGYIFLHLTLDGVSASVDPRNTRSIHLLERAGMRRTGFSQGWMEIRGELVDDARYGMNVDEYLARFHGLSAIQDESPG